MRPSSSTIETLTSSPLTIQNEMRALCTRASGVGEKTLKMCGRTTSGGELLSFCVTTNAPSVASTSRPNAMRARRVIQNLFQGEVEPDGCRIVDGGRRPRCEGAAVLRRASRVAIRRRETVPAGRRHRRNRFSQLRDLERDKRDVRHLERVEGGEAARVATAQHRADRAAVADDEGGQLALRTGSRGMPVDLDG